MKSHFQEISFSEPSFQINLCFKPQVEGCIELPSERIKIHGCKATEEAGKPQPFEVLKPCHRYYSA